MTLAILGSTYGQIGYIILGFTALGTPSYLAAFPLPSCGPMGGLFGCITPTVSGIPTVGTES